MIKEDARKRGSSAIVIVYPVVVLGIAVVLNSFAFGVNPAAVALPSSQSIFALVIAAILLLCNHTWMMTTTELTRVRYQMHSTPEEWASSGNNQRDASAEGLTALERRHNAHRNLTENTIYFIFLAFILVLVSPTIMAVQVWIIGFAIARLGYSYSYLAGRDQLRGLFMSLSLVAMYGMVSYLGVSLLV